MNNKMAMVIGFGITGVVTAWLTNLRRRKEIEESKRLEKEMDDFAKNLVKEAFPRPTFDVNLKSVDFEEELKES